MHIQKHLNKKKHTKIACIYYKNLIVIWAINKTQQKRQIKTITNQKQRRHSVSPNFVPAVLMNSSSSKISKLSSDLRNLKLGREGVELLLPLEPPPSPEGWALLAPSRNKFFKTTVKNVVSQPYESMIKIVIKIKGKVSILILGLNQRY